MSSENWNMSTFMKGASLLTISAIVVKLLAAIYRVPYQNLVGDQGFYIYQQVYPFVGIVMIWTSYGLAVAVSKLLADCETPEERRSTLRIAMSYLAIVAVLLFLLLTMSASYFAKWMGDAQLTPLLQAAAYIVLAMPFLAVLKGAFQARGQMTPVAVSGVAEQASRVAVILLGTWLAIKAGASLYSAGEIAIWGAVVGEFAGVLLLTLYFRRQLFGVGTAVRKRTVIKELTVISVSVSASSLILLLFQLVDSFTLYNELVANGHAREYAMELKGIYDRGQPLVQMGILVATTLALALVPLIAHHAANRDDAAAIPFIRLTFRVSVLFGVAATAGLALILPNVNEMLFETRAGSITLIVVVCQIFWLSLILPAAAILQGTGKFRVPIILFSVGIVVKLCANKFLIPYLDVFGAAIAGNIGLVVITIGLFRYFTKQHTFSLAPRRFYRTVWLATVAMVLLVSLWQFAFDYAVSDFLPSRIVATMNAVTSAMIGAIVFLFVCLKSRIMAEKEWYLLPFGKRLASIQLRLTKKRR